MPDGAQVQGADLDKLVAWAQQYKEAGKIDEAGNICSRIISMTPTPVTGVERHARAEAFNFLAAMAFDRSQYGTAMDFFHQSISLSPFPEISLRYRMNLVYVLLQVMWRERARQEVDRCRRMAPPEMMPSVLRLSALCARDEGDVARTVQDARLASESAADDMAVQLEYAAALCDAGQLDEAQHYYSLALDDEKWKAQAEHGIGLCKMRKMECEEAVEYFDRALSLQPGMSMAKWNRALSNLTLGNYEDGWREHEFRFQIGDQMKGVAVPAQRFLRPLWTGQSAEAIGKKRIHIHCEMGLGDTLQFCRYAPMVRALGHDVQIEAPFELETLLRESLPGIDVMPQAADWPGAHGIPDFDYHVPMMSLPFMFGTTLETVPWYGPYLKVQKAKVQEWKKRLVGDESQHTAFIAAKVKRPRIGICWHGRARHQLWVKELDNRRSVDFDVIRRAFEGLPFTFVSLDINPAPEGWTYLVQPYRDIHDFTDTAGLIANLDMVISVDTSVLHLAAGLGRETWMLNRYDSCWRWMTEVETSPWYPSLRIYRQTKDQQGQWGDVLARVVADLKEKFKC